MTTAPAVLHRVQAPWKHGSAQPSSIYRIQTRVRVRDGQHESWGQTVYSRKNMQINTKRTVTLAIPFARVHYKLGTLMKSNQWLTPAYHSVHVRIVGRAGHQFVLSQRNDNDDDALAKFRIPTPALLLMIHRLDSRWQSCVFCSTRCSSTV